MDGSEITLLTVSALRSLPPGVWTGVTLHAQVDALQDKTTRDGKPFREISIADASEKCVIRVWSDAPEFQSSSGIASGAFIELGAEVSVGGAYGPEFRRWTWRPLEELEKARFLAGTPEQLAKLEADWQFVRETLAEIRDPRLNRLCIRFAAEFDARFRRTAAARAFHHARRGGLLEHTAQMMRSAVAIASVYPELNRDLLVSGVLFHDCGKMWENPVAEEGLTIGFTEAGELMGHIALGMELVNHTWRQMREAGELEEWKDLQPASESVRMHLVHLVASHHGTHEFGSPVEPKTPEAFALHYIDNLDAKLEAVRAGYARAPLLTPTIHERSRPLNVNLIEPLPAFRDVGLEES